MSNNYESGTVAPYFPTTVVRKFNDRLGNLTVQEGVGDDASLSYLYFEENISEIDEIVAVLQDMLVVADIPFCTIEAAAYCDKMRPNEFGGWAVFITPDEDRWMNTGSWLASQEENLKHKTEHKSDFMPVGKALNIVYELANENALSKAEARENDLTDEYESQAVALHTVHDLIVNQYGEE